MVEIFANSGDPDQTPHSVASDQGLHCLPITLLGVSRQQYIKEMNTILRETTLSKVFYFLSEIGSTLIGKRCVQEEQILTFKNRTHFRRELVYRKPNRKSQQFSLVIYDGRSTRGLKSFNPSRAE